MRHQGWLLRLGAVSFALSAIAPAACSSDEDVGTWPSYLELNANTGGASGSVTVVTTAAMTSATASVGSIMMTDAGSDVPAGGAGGAGSSVSVSGVGGGGGAGGAGGSGSGGSGSGGCAGQPDMTACNDGNPCTMVDYCANGACIGVLTVMCVSPIEDCKQSDGVCDQNTGQCIYGDAPDGTPCEDGNLCTKQDACMAGACMPSGFQETCMTSDPCYESVGMCSPGSGMCSFTPKPNGTACGGQAGQCVTGGMCSAGVCVGGSPKPNGDPCEDGNKCTVGDTCSMGACSPGAPTVCQPGACQVNALCDPGTGLCASQPAVDNSPCSDGNACTEDDTCQGGACAQGTPKQCVNLNPCFNTDGTCDGVTGMCEFTQKGVGEPCGGGASDCVNAGTCDAAGSCSGSPKMDGTGCDDSDECTLTDACAAGVCVGGDPKTCPLAQCDASASCDSATGMCSYMPKVNGEGCDDGDACTQLDTCQGGMCTGMNAIVCDPVPCYAQGTCDPASGACSSDLLPNGSACGGETGTCIASGTCTDGVCSGPPVEDGTPCPDLIECTVEKCKTGQCVSAPALDGVPCEGGAGICVAGACLVEEPPAAGSGGSSGVGASSTVAGAGGAGQGGDNSGGAKDKEVSRLHGGGCSAGGGSSGLELPAGAALLLLLASRRRRRGATASGGPPSRA